MTDKELDLIINDQKELNTTEAVKQEIERRFSEKYPGRVLTVNTKGGIIFSWIGQVICTILAFISFYFEYCEVHVLLRKSYGIGWFLFFSIPLALLGLLFYTWHWFATCIEMTVQKYTVRNLMI